MYDDIVVLVAFAVGALIIRGLIAVDQSMQRRLDEKIDRALEETWDEGDVWE